MIWDATKIEMVDCWVGLFSVSILGRLRGYDKNWVAAGVYGPQEGILLHSFLEELGSMQDRWEGAWCL